MSPLERIHKRLGEIIEDETPDWHRVSTLARQLTEQAEALRKEAGE